MIIKLNQITPLNRNEQSILLLLIDKIEVNINEIEFTNTEISNYIESVNKERIFRSLISKNLGFKCDDGDFIVSWFTSVKFQKQMIVVTINPVLKDYLIYFKKVLNTNEIKNILSFNNAYTIKLYYHILKQKNDRRWIVSIKEIKYILNLLDKYKLYGHLKDKVIIPTIEEINNKTNFKIILNEIKDKKRVVKIEFIIKEK